MPSMRFRKGDPVTQGRLFRFLNVRLLSGLGIAVVVVALDQASKFWLLRTMLALPPEERGFSVTNFFNIVLALNRGVSFGLFNDGGRSNGLVFSALAAALISALIVWLYRCDTRLLMAGIGLVIGGAVGNVLDRLRLGAVVDFLDFHWGTIHFWAFNLADTAISVGVVLLVLDSLLARREARSKD